MDSSQSLTLDQRTVMRLSAQQLRFVRMLEMTAPELDEAVERELEDNPALEALDPPEADNEIPRYWLHASNRSADDYADCEFAPAAMPETLVEYADRQLAERSLPEKVAQAARFIAASLDSNGYLRRPLASLVNDMAFGPGIEVTIDEARRALAEVQDLEPYGIGASDLRETLAIQLRHLPESQTRNDALEIVGNHFDAFTKKHTHRIMSGLHIDRERATRAIDLIVGLNPKPGAQYAATEVGNAVIPDLTVSNEGGRLSVQTNNRIPELAIDRTFAEAVRQMEAEKLSRQARRGSEFITTRYNDARDFIKILRQRQETLLSVMTAILQIQKEYFQTEDIYKLKPMMIKDIAAITGLDLSVISRATNNKFVQTPWGIFPLRFFFSDSIGDEEEGTQALTNRKIEAEIESIVDKEDKRHPLSDERIREMMETRGFDVSRRTVAKYRDRKGIPVARLRKEM